MKIPPVEVNYLKKLSSRAVAVITNLALSLILIVVGTVCFLPSAGAASGLEDRVIRKGTSKEGVSLMINVYWGAEEVLKMLDIFGQYGARATFFLGGSWADDNVSCVREIAARGHEIGSHGYFHRAHDTLDLEGNNREIGASVEFLNLIAGRPVTLFAPPSGAYNDATLEAAEGMGLKTVLWSKDTVDWRDKDAETVFRRATEGIEGGDLVLMHPMPHTVEALPRILAYYRAHGLSVIPVGENL